VPVFGSRQPISEGRSRRLSVFTHRGPAWQNAPDRGQYSVYCTFVATK
jgi:hypothetical protein